MTGELKKNVTNSKTVLEGTEVTIHDEVVDIFTLRPHPSNNYEITPESIDTLALNIEEVGLLDYPYVRRVDDGGLQILSGHRRIRALKQLAKKDDKWREIKVRIAENLDDDMALIILHSGNLYRPVTQEERTKLTEDLEKRVKEMRTKNPELRGKRTGEILAKLLGTSPATYNRKLRLSKQLDPELYNEFYKDGLLPLTHAWELCRQTGEYQRGFYDLLVDNKCKTRNDVVSFYNKYITTTSKLIKDLSKQMQDVRNTIVEIRGLYKAKKYNKDSYDVSDLKHARKELNALIDELEGFKN